MALYYKQVLVMVVSYKILLVLALNQTFLLMCLVDLQLYIL
jgi:hypothetical protein